MYDIQQPLFFLFSVCFFSYTIKYFHPPHFFFNPFGSIIHYSSPKKQPNVDDMFLLRII
jgi:hypothetical protein